MAVEQMTRTACVRAGSGPARPREGADLPLRGREPELEPLQGRLAALAREEGGVVVIEGPPGSGRTRLLAEVRTRALAAGLSCRQETGGFPGPPGPMLEAPRTGSAPLVVCLDDVQWFDPLTSAALATLLDDSADTALLWVLAGERVPSVTSGALPLLERTRKGRGHRIVLGPLPDRAAIALAADLLGAEPGETIRHLVRRAGGMPGPVVELLQGMREDGLVAIRDGVASATAETIPRRFHAMVRRRLDRLPPPARVGVQSAAVLDRAFTVEELGLLTGSPVGEVAAGASAAVDAGILLSKNAHLEFQHDLMRQAVAETLPVALRRSLRRRSVDVRVAGGARAVDIAADLAASAVPGDHRAVALLREAAADLAPDAPAEAVVLCRRALELSGTTGPCTAEIVGETVDLLGRIGRYTEAEALADTAFKGFLTPQDEAGLRLRVARVVGHYSAAEALRQCRTALTLPGLPVGLRAGLSAVQALHLAQTGRAAQAIAAGDRVPAGTGPAAEATVLAARAGIELSRLNLDLAFELQDRADALLQDAADADTARSRTPEPPWAPAACGRAYLLAASGRIRAALRETDDGVRTARRTGHTAAAHLWSMARVGILLAAGRLDAVRTAADTALASSGSPPSGDGADAAVRYALGRAAVHLGDREGIRRCAADGARMMDDEAPAVRRAGAWLAALAADALGDTARVATLIERAWEAPEAPGSPPGTPPDPADHVVLVRLALRAGLPGPASAAAARAESLDHGYTLFRGVAAQARGIVDGDPDLLLHAVKLFEETERPLVRASAAEDAGRVLGERGDPAARHLLDAALDLYGAAGAARDAARVRRRLRLLGVRRAHRPRDGAEEGRWGLTAAEVEVVRLVARGATNRQVAEQLFLSRHTVNTHLRHVFAKWDINSRVDLARLVLAYEAE
ncbi:LuxR C-terminal-related transcriptional regulator [Spirillospora sp. NPDC052242]